MVAPTVPIDTMHRVTTAALAALAATTLLAASYLRGAMAWDNGLALVPPMGWRSWNAYHSSVTQQKMQDVMRAMVDRSLTVDGKPTSMLDLGYANCGLDDNWQQCGAGVRGSFTDAAGNPIINTTAFPSMKGMVDFAHSLGLKAGWCESRLCWRVHACVHVYMGTCVVCPQHRPSSLTFAPLRGTRLSVARRHDRNRVRKT